MPRGRPKSTKKAIKSTNVSSVRKTCVSCPKNRAERPLSDFWISYNPFHADGKLPICKDCIINECFDNEKDKVDLQKIKLLLRQLNKPFIRVAYQAAVDEYERIYLNTNVPKGHRKLIVSNYFKNINSLPQYKTLTWEDTAEHEKNIYAEAIVIGIEQSENEDIKSEDNKLYYLQGSENFQVTDKIIRLFGEGFKKSEYKAMWEKYDFLSKNYNDITNLHTEALITYIRFKVREEFATAKGEVVEAEKWSKAALSASEKAKINPSQLSKNDLQGGLNSFSELFQAVEQAIDVIPILPQFRYRPNDAIDFNIWCMINYLRRLEDKPLCEYEDIYNFYDERKREYIEQYGDPHGIFSGDTTEFNRDNIKKFIALPKDYIDIEEETEDDVNNE